LIIVEEYYHAVHQDFHAAVELNNDLSSLFTSGKSLTSLITDGAYAFAHLKTNNSELVKTLIDSFLKPAKPVAEKFLEDGFNLQLTKSAEEALTLCNSACGEACQEFTGLTTDAILPMAQMTLEGVKPMIDNPPMPFLQTLVDLAKNNLKTNFSLSFKIAEGLFTVHFKTGGVKQLLGYWVLWDHTMVVSFE